MLRSESCRGSVRIVPLPHVCEGIFSVKYVLQIFVRMPDIGGELVTESVAPSGLQYRSLCMCVIESN